MTVSARIIATERLLLTPLTVDDAEDMLAVLGDGELVWRRSIGE